MSFLNDENTQPQDQDQSPENGDASSDYAALLRRIRGVDNLKLEVNQLQIKLKNAENRIGQLEPYIQSLEQTIAERDQQLEEMRGASGSRGLMAALKKKDETIQRLQQALQNKHREIEDLKTGRRR